MTTIDELLDACPEDESIFLWYGVIWDAMLEAKDPRADGMEYLIRERKRPRRIKLRGKYVFDWVSPPQSSRDRLWHCRVDQKLAAYMRQQWDRWMGEKTPGDAIRFFLDAYVSVYQPQTA